MHGVCFVTDQRPTSRRTITAWLLLASMLFYVSGAALSLHLKLDHAKSKAVIVQTGCAHGTHNTTSDAEPAPTETPETPSKKQCELCDMLMGTTKPMAIAAPAQPLFTLTLLHIQSTPTQVCVYQQPTPDISRRGPPCAA